MVATKAVAVTGPMLGTVRRRWTRASWAASRSMAWSMVDGATRIQALLRIVLPIAVPRLVCAALFAFTLSWNEFIYALTFTSSSEEITAGVRVTSELIRDDICFWGGLMAGAVLGSVPIVILYVFLLDYYVSGLTAGAVK
jgi:multiple sugar transport system permease protein